jgi:tetratricopeptide (TPR) repeat protein
VSEQLELLTRAQLLTEQLGKAPNLPVLRMLAVNHIVNTHYRQSMMIGEKLLAAATALQDPVLFVEGHYVAGVSHSPLGSFEEARAHLGEAIRYYNPEKAHIHIALFAWDPKAICLCRQAINLWCLGFVDQAIQAANESTDYADTIGHPFSRAYARSFAALLHYLRRDLEMVHQEATTAMQICHEHGIQFWLTRAQMLEGWAIAASGDPESGIATMKSAMASSNSLGIRALNGVWATLFAESYSMLGRTTQSIESLEEVLSVLTNNIDGDHWYEAELYRALGDMFLANANDLHQVESAYRRAIEVAQQQKARSFELRAATSLAHLWQAQGRIAEARALLQPVYDWFTEGFDTPDLRAAKALLGQLTLA